MIFLVAMSLDNSIPDFSGMRRYLEIHGGSNLIPIQTLLIFAYPKYANFFWDTLNSKTKLSEMQTENKGRESNDKPPSLKVKVRNEIEKLEILAERLKLKRGETLAIVYTADQNTRVDFPNEEFGTPLVGYFYLEKVMPNAQMINYESSTQLEQSDIDLLNLCYTALKLFLILDFEKYRLNECFSLVKPLIYQTGTKYSTLHDLFDPL